MNIGELAQHTGVSIRSLRYYETKQLLSAQRQENGYRSYEEAAIERVRAIQFYLGLGLTTKEIADVVFCDACDDVAALLGGEGEEICPEEIELYQEKLAEIEMQMESLQRARAFIKQKLAHMNKAALSSLV